MESYENMETSGPGDLIKNQYKILKTLTVNRWESIFLVEEQENQEEYILKKIKEYIENRTIEDTLNNEFGILDGVSHTIEKKIDSPKIKDFFIEDYNIYIVIEHKKKTLNRLKAYPSLGRTLDDRYLVLKGIASGGFGIVYLVKDLTLPDKYWALKEMHEVEGNPALIEKTFKKEATILSKLDHPVIPTVTHFFTSSNKHYLVMDYIKGETLREKLSKLSDNEYFPEEKIINWTLTLCDVLFYLHNQPKPIVFRDLKPDNIMINHKGEIKLIDFGIARIFEGPGGSGTTSHALLTQGYAPPEQWLGKAEPRSDIYSLGATLYHLLTKIHPQKYAPNFVDPVKLNPNISIELNDIIMHSLNLVMRDRYQSIEEMKSAIEKIKSNALIKKLTDKALEFENKNDCMEAAFQYKKALELSPFNEEILFSISSCYKKVGLFDEAKKYLQKISQITRKKSSKEKAEELIENFPQKGTPSSADSSPGNDRTSPMSIVSISNDSLKAGEEGKIAIKIPANFSSREIKEKTLITTTREGADTITGPEYDENDSFLRSTITSTIPGTSIIKVIDKNTGELIGQQLRITFTAGLPDPQNSKISVEKNDAAADETTPVVINITLIDKFKNPVNSIFVKAKSDRKADNIEEPPLTNSEGKTNIKIYSSLPGKSLY